MFIFRFRLRIVSTRVSRVVFRASVKLFELGVRKPVGLFLGTWYAGGIDFRRFPTPSLPIFGIILDLLETTKQTSKYARVYSVIN